MNTTKKINSLLSSGAVSMTGPTQSRIVKNTPQLQQQQQQQHQQHQQKQHLVSSSAGASGTTVQYVNHNANTPKHCYVCDDIVHAASGQVLTDAVTTITNTKVPNKIGRVVGDAFMVIISVDDVVCKRCMTMFNHMDRLENDLERVKTNVLTLINKKYGIQPDDKLVSTTTTTPTQQQQQPPHKVQRLNTSQTLGGGQRKTSNGADAIADEEVTVTRKITTTSRQVVVANDAHDLHQQPQPHQSGSSAQIVQRQGTTITPVQNATASATVAAANAAAKKPGQTTKIYKCMSCDFKTVDLKQFQPHYETCKQQNAGYRCKLCKKLFTNMNALKVHTAEKHANAASVATGADFVCSICNINYVNEPSLRKHMETNHPDVKTIESAANATNATATTTTTTITQQQHQPQQQQQQQQTTTVVYQCGQCQFKTADKVVFDEHQRKHQAKVKPFKCRLCSQRFETREQASVHAKSHQPDYFKCGKCAMSFPQRELLMKHFETHKPTNNQQLIQQQKQQQQQQQQQQAISAAATAAAAAAAQQQDLTTQKLLQETIDEALRDTGEADSKIHFFSCNICSLTFIQENYYNQHMETHKRESKKPVQQQQQQPQQQQQQQQHHVVVTEAATIPAQSTSSLIKQEVRNTNSTILHSTQSGQISDADIESMFEKMHSDKPADGQQQSGNENMVITSQGTTAGGISFSISIPQGDQQQQDNIKIEANNAANNGEQQLQQSIGIDMPMLTDQAEEHHQTGAAAGHAVSMPSLDDDGSDAAAQQQQQQDQHEQQQLQQASADQQQQHMPMDLEEMQNAAESGQIKFILNEDGQILQLDNHIITTDADGNQILVQGADSEQIQQLLQQVGVLQGDGGDGETFQMIQGENNQMIFVQGGSGGQAVAVGGGEHSGGDTHQLIDASMLNEDGHLVLQPGEELPEGMHVVGADGVHVPVSIAYAQNEQQQQQQQQEAEQQQDQHDEAQQLQQQLEEQHQQQQQLELEQQHQEQEQAQQAQDQAEEAAVDNASATEEAAQQQQVATVAAVAEPSSDMIDIEDQIDAVCIATTIGQEQINAALAAAQTTTAGGLTAATTVVTAEGSGAPVVIATTAPSTTTTSSDGNTSTTVTLSGQPNVSSTTGEVFFNLEDLMQHSDEPTSKQQDEQTDAEQPEEAAVGQK